MIGVERKGRLGNQMFVCAFGIAASQQLDTRFYLAEGELHRVFTLDDVPRARELPFRALRKAGLIRRQLVPLEAEPGTLRVRDWTHYDGYFQSERWFAGAEDSVRRAFTFREPVEPVGGDYVAVHVRRGDYRTWRDGATLLSPDWYRQALAALNVDAPVVFVSDEDVAEDFAEVKDARFQTGGSMTGDMQTLTHARWIVTSASSFSWWGAWLSDAETVIVPRYWAGFADGAEWPPYVIPAAWTQLAV